MIKELQSLSLDVKVYTEEQNELAIEESDDDDDIEELDVNIEGNEDDGPQEADYEDNVEFLDDEFIVEDNIDSLENAQELDVDAVDRLFATDDDLLDDDDDI